MHTVLFACLTAREIIAVADASDRWPDDGDGNKPVRDVAHNSDLVLDLIARRARRQLECEVCCLKPNLAVHGNDGRHGLASEDLDGDTELLPCANEDCGELRCRLHQPYGTCSSCEEVNVCSAACSRARFVHSSYHEDCWRGPGNHDTMLCNDCVKPQDGRDWDAELGDARQQLADCRAKVATAEEGLSAAHHAADKLTAESAADRAAASERFAAWLASLSQQLLECESYVESATTAVAHFHAPRAALGPGETRGECRFCAFSFVVPARA